jgi:hypothetical protein
MMNDQGIGGAQLGLQMKVLGDAYANGFSGRATAATDNVGADIICPPISG